MNTLRRSVLRSFMRSRTKIINMYYVYIIQSQKDRSYYTGSTNNLKKRLEQHNKTLVKSTSSKAPYQLIWYCAFIEKKKAFDFEKYLKNGSGFAFARKRFV